MGDAPERAAAQTRLARHLSRKHLASDGFQDSLEARAELPAAPKKKEVQTKLAGWKHFVAGGVAGACEVIGTMPLDVAKTQMQLNPGKFHGPINACVTIARTGGPQALYYGMPAFLTQTSAKAAIRFFGFSQFKEITTMAIGQEKAKENETLVNLVAGLFAGAGEAALWTTPTERLKVLRQAEANSAGPKRYNSMLGTTKIIVQEQGVRGMFVGLVPCVIRQASSVGFRFMCYKPTKDVLTSVTGLDEGVGIFMLAGGTVGALSVAANNPVDVIKNIQQAGHKGGTIQVGREIFAESGVKGFYRGLSARVPRVFCGQAITFAAYETMAKFLLSI